MLEQVCMVQPDLIRLSVNLHLVVTRLHFSFSSRCLKLSGTINTVRTGLLPLKDKLLFISHTCSGKLHCLLSRYKVKGFRWNAWTPHSRFAPLYVILTANCIWFRFKQNRCDSCFICGELWPDLWSKIYNSRRTWTLSTICFSDTFYPNKSSLTSNSLTSNNHDLHEIS